MKKIFLLILVLIPFNVFALTTNADSATFVAASSQYASKSSGVSGLPLGSTARSISFWEKTSNSASQTVYEQGLNSSKALFEIFINVFAGSNNIGIGLNGGNVHYTATNLTNGSWHHFVFTYSGGVGIATGGKMYMDGNQLTQAGANDQTPNTDGTCIGLATEACSGLGAYMDGKIDDVRIWGRALSGSEVTSLYTNSCTFNNGSNFITQYLLDGNFNDSVGSNNLTAVNSPTFTSDVPYTCTAPSGGFYQFQDF